MKKRRRKERKEKKEKEEEKEDENHPSNWDYNDGEDAFFSTRAKQARELIEERLFLTSAKEAGEKETIDGVLIFANEHPSYFSYLNNPKVNILLS